MNSEDPNLVHSGLSRPFTFVGITVEVYIYRLESEPGWTLEVVNKNSTSTVWDMEFDTDSEAFEAFQLVVSEEGMDAFQDQPSNVVPFPNV